ncbi:hypothetical protein CERSUDRAFT_71359 [Gelatoporia subvermispora B]|uniref:DUF6533 domain-containing protein n=1 Tax=Ceriporiopsis subvermispora (strain B) TaxID=914234 RepID=M2RKX3_CERS8|nr:hypothetical protein CERSUDRAFT_71359 [Gelatoporia subvermispora B]
MQLRLSHASSATMLNDSCISDITAVRLISGNRTRRYIKASISDAQRDSRLRATMLASGGYVHHEAEQSDLERVDLAMMRSKEERLLAYGGTFTRASLHGAQRHLLGVSKSQPACLRLDINSTSSTKVPAVTATRPFHMRRIFCPVAPEAVAMSTPGCFCWKKSPHLAHNNKCTTQRWEAGAPRQRMYALQHVHSSERVRVVQVQTLGKFTREEILWIVLLLSGSAEHQMKIITRPLSILYSYTCLIERSRMSQAYGPLAPAEIEIALRANRDFRYSLHIAVLICNQALTIAVIVIYDHLTTLAREHEFMWCRKLSSVTLLFYLNRWTIFVWALTTLALGFTQFTTATIYIAYTPISRVFIAQFVTFDAYTFAIVNNPYLVTIVKTYSIHRDATRYKFKTPLVTMLLRNVMYDLQKVEDAAWHSAVHSGNGTSEPRSPRFASFVDNMGELLGHDDDCEDGEMRAMDPSASEPQEASAPGDVADVEVDVVTYPPDAV